ncbi:MAG TPA: glycosyltransferase family 4 protein [Puia sp.]|jgi:glycosyltransferase involved in cell wall biosynthesis|nr:glycosyltransferase family 4 protein [Puia sp.]
MKKDNCKLSFITLNHYYPWGGSEELWKRTALMAVSNAISVEAHVFEISRNHNKVSDLINAGVNMHFRKNDTGVYGRLLKKLKLQSLNSKGIENYWGRHLQSQDTLYVISSGTTFDCVGFPSLFEHLASGNMRYVYVSQHNPEHEPLKGPAIQKAITIFQNAERVYFVSERNLKVAEHQLACHITNAEIIFNPSPESVNKAADYPLGEEQLRMASVARLETGNKGQDLLLQVLALPNWSQRNFILSFYGSGPDEEYLKELVLYYNLQDKVRFAGHVEDVREIWAKNHVLVMPSFTEGTPLALLEAMSFKRAAVVTDVGGNAEWITDGLNGFVAAAPAPGLLETALENMWNKKGSLQEMGLKAFDAFKTKYPGDAVSFFYDKIMSL